MYINCIYYYIKASAEKRNVVTVGYIIFCKYSTICPMTEMMAMATKIQPNTNAYAGAISHISSHTSLKSLGYILVSPYNRRTYLSCCTSLGCLFGHVSTRSSRLRSHVFCIQCSCIRSHALQPDYHVRLFDRNIAQR